MIDPLAFLKKLQADSPPVVTHLLGDERFICETLIRRIVETWCGAEGDWVVDRLVGTAAISELPSRLGSGSLFAERKVIVLADPAPGEKGTALSGMGKNQQAQLVATLKQVPADLNRVVLETASMKATSAAAKELAKVATQVDVSAPSGVAKKNWIQLLAKKARVNLSSEVGLAMAASGAPLLTLAADLEKIALAVSEGAEATLEQWRDLSQSDPEATVWEIGDELGAGKPGEALARLRALQHQGMTLHEILPSLLSWNQQRLRVKSYRNTGGTAAPEGVHPFVVKKMTDQIRRKSLKDLRQEQRDLLYLDRCSKQSWEDPEILLEKFLIKAAVGGRK